MSAWPEVETDLRRALLRTGCGEAAADRTLADLASIFAAVEGARVRRVEPELCWACRGRLVAHWTSRPPAGDVPRR